MRRALRRVAKLCRGLLTGWLVLRLLGPEVQPRYATPQERPLRLTGRTILVGEREMFVREAGHTTAPPLVLVHGWSLDGEATFHRMIPRLAARYHLIVPDHRNHGRSAWIRGPHEIGDVAEELAGVLDGLDVSNAAVFGWSMGGMVTQELARRRGDLVGRMILGATAAHPIPRHRVATRVLFWVSRLLGRISREELAKATATVLVRTGSLEARHRRWMREVLLRRDPTLYYEAGVAIWRFDSRGWIGALDLPAMVVVCTADQLVPVAAQRDLARRLRTVRVVELAGARHEAVFNRADEIAEAIEGFVPSS